MKYLLMLLFLVPLIANSQNNELLAEGVTPAMYVTHKVDVKENFYSIGRIYNISPKEIAPFNDLPLESGLSIGQELRIPLSTSNFFQSGTAAPDETFVPVHYIVKGKEGLYRVANNHNLPLEDLRKWNKIKGDAVKANTKLVIGYLKVKKELSYLAKNGIGNTIDASITDEVNVSTKTNETVNKTPVPPVKQEEKKITYNKAPEIMETALDPRKQPSKTVKQEAASGENVEGGIFKSLYPTGTKKSDAVTAETGIAGVFKSTSGWRDDKYYCLYNSAAPGTIIKITSTNTGKTIYAKVLDIIPDIKQNDGLLILISSASANMLGETESNFSCAISFYK